MTAAGPQRELARYQLPNGTRAVVAQGIDGRVGDQRRAREGQPGARLPNRAPRSQPGRARRARGPLRRALPAGRLPAVVAQRRQLDELIDTVA